MNNILNNHGRFLTGNLLFFAFLLISAVFPAAAQEAEGFSLDFGRYNMSLTPKVLEDGAQTDFSFGIFYTNAMKFAGEIRLRYESESANDIVWGINDSLLTRDRTVFELFFLPVKYHFFKGQDFSLYAGAGLYYEYNKLQENGFFNDSSLYEPAGPDHYNAYVNDFTGHAVGPLIDAGVNYQNNFFYGSLSVGVVPVFYMDRSQTWKLSPFMDPPSYNVASKGFSSPYFYINLDAAVSFRYFSLFASLLYEYSRLSYIAAGFTDSGTWSDVAQIFEYRNLAFEISVLVNLGYGGFMPQIGYGRIFNEVTGGSNYIVVGVKKLWF